MKKAFKIYLRSWVAYIAIIIFGSIALLATTQGVSEHHKYLVNLSESPKYIEKIIKVDLPDIVHVKPDRGYGNIWSIYRYELKFSEELSEDCMRELNMRYKKDKAHWSTNSGAFIYRESASSEYELSCLIYKDHSIVDYGFSDEDISDSELALLVFIAGGFWILVFVGVILGVIGAICEQRREKTSRFCNSNLNIL